ncbi:glycosyltransferase family 76 protein [Jaapia argillacea MUCL 33604]|uniref:GPI mannosyltransferase 2 n=1 Tax=Jaapia argillacea MUCL 33604 TaxID=933084 RepID=A0A067PSD5_9AGAM|nr:glycosyltransferase family 76 protein [Jaapia argillacea MUCL 33604]
MTSAKTSKLRPTHLILLLTLLTRFLILVLIYLSSYLPSFDSSPNILLPPPPLDASWAEKALWRVTNPLLRWDSFHFAHIAKEGHVFEHEWAFLPGIANIMRLSAQFIRLLFPHSNPELSVRELMVGGALASFLVDVLTPLTLYKLTLRHFPGRPSIALISALLGLLPSSPATLRYAPYTEPFFTFFSYQGMLACANGRYLLASTLFACAGAFRSNGVLLGGFVIWDLVAYPFLQRKSFSIWRAVYATILTALIFTPFIAHQHSAYTLFCSSPPPSSNPNPIWCNKTLPSIYTYVQSKYWNVGFLTYWTPSQIPNFIISIPPLLLLFAFSSYHLVQVIPRLLFPTPTSQLRKQKRHLESNEVPPSPFLSETLTPHAIHALVLSLTLLFASHTQIVLRLAASMPILYWAGAWLLVEEPEFSMSGLWRGRGRAGEKGKLSLRGSREEQVGKGKGVRWGSWWVGWSVVWGSVSVVLWTTFLPPA